MKFKRLFNALKNTGAILIFLLIWEIFPRAGFVDAAFLPPFSKVFESLVGLVVSGEIFPHIFISLTRALTGFGLALAIGIPLGFFMGWFKAFEGFIDPLLQTFRQVPTLALYPAFILLLGIGEMSKVAIIWKGAFWPILLSTISGVKNVDPLLIKSARSMGVGSGINLFKKVVLPSALPSIMVGVRLSATLSLVVLVAAEMLGAKSGIGYLVVNSEFTFLIPKMYAGIVVITLLGLLLNYVFVALEKKAVMWKEEIK